MSKLKKAVTPLLAAWMLCNCAMVPAFATPSEPTEPAVTTPAETDTQFSDVEEIVYSVGNVNVRTGPGLGYPVITTLRYGQAILRTGVGDNGWSRVSYDGGVAYMYTSLLTTKNPAGESNPGNGGTDNRLTRQIAIANGLKELDYTSESWAAMTAALEKAQKALSGGNQESIDAAADTLEKAIAALVTMDYAALDQAIAKAKEQTADSEAYELISRLNALIEKAQTLRTSGDQAAVNACVTEITALLEEADGYLGQGTEPEVIIQEVEVEVPPSDDYCNISSHRIWFVAFLASLTVNVMLALVIATLLVKKRYKAEDVPLVDYDIDDDF